MKKIFILNASRRRKGNTTKLISSVTEKLKDFDIEIAHPQDFNIKTCLGCHKCFIKAGCVQRDDLPLLAEKILNSDLLILASPVYLHYMTGELKMILDKLAWWAHTLRLQGKPVVLLSTCSTNGQDTVIKPLGEIMNYMGGNVIATANASMVPDQINNLEWLDSVSEEISSRITKSIIDYPKANIFTEKIFSANRISMLEQVSYFEDNGIKNGELEFWKSSGMLEFETFSEYLAYKYQNKES
ncbi:flavodoxin family protein [Lactococcus ileimucosae]|uniref:flavodoxin family protein n=1 Tax=Lactococcus ileimucosae TaxID=2941329 RepID=UPI003513E7CB